MLQIIVLMMLLITEDIIMPPPKYRAAPPIYAAVQELFLSGIYQELPISGQKAAIYQ